MPLNGAFFVNALTLSAVGLAFFLAYFAAGKKIQSAAWAQRLLARR